jgi:hypothetical protein
VSVGEVRRHALVLRTAAVEGLIAADVLLRTEMEKAERVRQAEARAASEADARRQRWTSEVESNGLPAPSDAEGRRRLAELCAQFGPGAVVAAASALGCSTRTIQTRIAPDRGRHETAEETATRAKKAAGGLKAKGIKSRSKAPSAVIVPDPSGWVKSRS